MPAFWAPFHLSRLTCLLVTGHRSPQFTLRSAAPAPAAARPVVHARCPVDSHPAHRHRRGRHPSGRHPARRDPARRGPARRHAAPCPPAPCSRAPCPRAPCTPAPSPPPRRPPPTTPRPWPRPALRACIIWNCSGVRTARSASWCFLLAAIRWSSIARIAARWLSSMARSLVRCSAVRSGSWALATAPRGAGGWAGTCAATGAASMMAARAK